MADKKLVASTVSSRETGLKRRAETVTMSSHEDKETEKQNKKDGVHISFKSKDSKIIFFTGNKEDKTNKENRKAAAKSKNEKMHGIVVCRSLHAQQSKLQR